MTKILQAGDRVRLVPAHAEVFGATEEDLRKVRTIARVENDFENTRTERIWIEDETEPQAAMYYQLVI